MIPAETEAEILRLYHAEKWRIGTIAAQIGVHHTTVRRVLAQAQIPAGRQSIRPSIADRFIAFIVEKAQSGYIRYPGHCVRHY